MIRKTVTYTDFGGNSVTDALYFHLKDDKLVQLNRQFNGGLTFFVEELQATSDGEKAYELVRTLLTMSYGERSADMKSFIQNARTAEYFEGSIAIDILCIELLQNPKELVQFITGLLSAEKLAALKATNEYAQVQEMIGEPIAPPALEIVKAPEPTEG